MAPGADDALEQLREIAAAAAAAHGHELGPWVAQEGSLRATCTRCNAVAAIRVEGGMSGMIGSALREPCGWAGGDPRTAD